MNDKTYTAVGYLDIGNNLINFDITLPPFPDKDTYEITYYNLSKKSEFNGIIMNTILCEFTFKGDLGDELPSPTENRYYVSLDYTKIPKAPMLSKIEDFDFLKSENCLFIFFHSTAPDDYDRETFFNELEKFYLGAESSSYVMCPAPLTEKATMTTGKPRASGLSIIK